LELKKPSQLGYRGFFDPANQDEHCESPSRLSLNPESHRSANSATIPAAAVPHCTASIRAAITGVQPIAQSEVIENRGLKKKLE
jgi:hypothetical protein